LYRIGENVKPFVQPIKVLRPGQSAEEIKRTTIWEEMFGKGSLGDIQTDVHVKSLDELSTPVVEKRSRYSTVFDGPAYTLPPVDLLLDKFLDDFLGLSTSINESTHSADNVTSGQVSTEIIYADWTAPSVDVDAAIAEGKVFVDDGMVLPDKGKRAKVVSDADVEELSGWFTDVLAPCEEIFPCGNRLKKASLADDASLSPRTVASHPVHPQSTETPMDISTPTPASARSTPSQATPSKVSNVSSSRPATFVMPEFSAKKRKEQEVATSGTKAAEGPEGQKVGSKRKSRPSEV
jgi:hypothetical protein